MFNRDQQNIYAFIKKTKIHDSSRFHERSTKRKKSILIKLHDSHRIQSRSKPYSSSQTLEFRVTRGQLSKSFSPRKQDECRCAFRKKVFEYGFFVHGLWDRDACGKLKEGTLLYRFEVSDPSLENTSPDGGGCLRATKIPSLDSSPPLFLAILYIGPIVYTMSTGFRGCLGDYGLARRIY